MDNLAKSLPELKPPMKFDTNYQECPMCFNCGFTEVTRHDQLGRPYRGVIRCQSCDYWFKLAAKLGADK
jgi:hypothetical protein